MKKKFDFGKKTTKATIIDCMECENYYTGACDGRAGGCDTYTPTRKMTMDRDIKDITRLCMCNWIVTTGIALAFSILLIASIFAL